MRLFGLEASTSNISLCAMEGERVLFYLYEKKLKKASSILVDLEQILKRRKISLSEFDYFVIGAGPGSFTGLRISFSIVKGLSFSLRRPAISLGSFFSIVEQVRDKGELIAVISDARRGFIYGSTFCTKNNKIVQRTKERLYKLSDFIKKYSNLFFVTYDNFLREKAKELNPHINFYPYDIWPNALSLLKVVKEREKFLEEISLNRLEPIYVYPRECQIIKPPRYG